MHIFSENAPRYIEAGLSIIPVDGKKACTPQWSDHCRASAPKTLISKWCEHFGDHNVGLCLGVASGLMAFDLDTDDKAIGEIVKAVLPPTPLKKRGKKGITLFYKYSGQKSRTIKRGTEQIADVLADGRQTVIPPSIHPDTHEPYVWLGSINWKDALAQAPDCPDELLAQVEARIQGLRAPTSVIAAGAGAPVSQGRNDTLKEYVCKIGNLYPLATVVDMAIAFDLKHHATPLFSDVKENRSADQRANALRFCQSVMAPFLKNPKPAPETPEYATKANGFFKEVPLIKNGKPVFGDDGKPEMRAIPDYHGMGLYLKHEEGLKTQLAFSYIFDQTHYRVINAVELKNKIDELTHFIRGPDHVSEFFRAIAYKTFSPDDEFIEPNGFINLKNGVLDVNGRRLIPRDKSWFFKYVLPHDYEPTATCPNWFKFLDFVFEGNGELADLSAEIFGYVLSGGKPWLHKAFFLDGSGRNGKSTWLEALKILIGEGNFSAVQMRNLDKPFSVVSADGKLANIVGELEGRDLNSELFKIAVGGEEITAAHKGKPEYKMKFLAKMIFAMNNPPQFKDSSAGNYEKLCILPFKRYIKEEERDASVIERISPEMSGILNWALEGLERLKKRGRLPSIGSVKETLAEYRESNDTVYQWCEEFVRCGESEAESGYVLGAFYGHYAEWCKGEGRFAVSKVWFCRSLLREMKVRVPNVRIDKPQNKTRCVGAFIITAKYDLFSTVGS